MRLFHDGKANDVPDWPDSSKLSLLSENELIDQIQCKMGVVADAVGVDLKHPYYPVLASQTEQAIAVILSVGRIRTEFERDRKARELSAAQINQNSEEKLANYRRELHILCAMFFCLCTLFAISLYNLHQSESIHIVWNEVVDQCRETRLSREGHKGCTPWLSFDRR